MTNPKSKFHSSKHRPLKRTFCSILNFSIGSIDEKLISLNKRVRYILITCLYNLKAHLDTALHLRIFLGTLASCSSSGMLRSSLPCKHCISRLWLWTQVFYFRLTCHRILPVSASRRFIQFTRNPDKMSSAFAGILWVCQFVKIMKIWEYSYVDGDQGNCFLVLKITLIFPFSVCLTNSFFFFNFFWK